MEYKEYFKKLIAENKKRKDEFPNNKVFTHTGKNSHTNPRIHPHKGLPYNFVIASEDSKNFGSDFVGFVVELKSDKIAYWDILKAYENEIKKEFDNNELMSKPPNSGESPHWWWIFARLPANIEDESTWEKGINWQIDTMVKFLEVFPKYAEKEIPSKEKKMAKTEQPTEIKQPLNQILYGPPGTGKTYNTINRAIEIIEKRNVGDDEKRGDLKAKFEEYKKAGQIEFVTFHQSYGYEEFVEGIKAKTSDKGIEYEIESGIFKKLAKIASKNVEQSKENAIIKKEFALVFKEKILDQLFENEKLEIKMKKSSFFIKEVDETHISFDKSGGDSQHVLLIKNLKVMYEAGENTIIVGGLSQYYNPLLEYLLENNKIENNEKEQLQNYILIIDEINRGNISKIFGELITLIEPSKRIGADEEIRVRLPYSGDLFGMPSNLYILGTMNTADRSIALMDTALRRRFEFVEMMPRGELLDFEVEGVNIKSLLETINKRIEYLYDRDHTIGHAYFIDVKSKDDLDNVMRNKIIPLLQEYFYDDWEKIRLVLGDNQKPNENEQFQFIKIKKNFKIEQLFGSNISDIDINDEQKIYEINTEAFAKMESYKKIYETN